MEILDNEELCVLNLISEHNALTYYECYQKEIYLYVTHCENTILEGDLLSSGLVKRVYTTNSIFTKEHEKIEVFEL